MKILVIGNAVSRAEFNSKFGASHQVVFKDSSNFRAEDLPAAEIVFDFEITSGSHGHIYRQNSKTILFLNTVMTTASELAGTYELKHAVIGFNGLSGMFNKPLLELTTDGQSPAFIKQLCDQLGTKYRLVKDRIGMVTPRVICMIINEAFYTIEEDTALMSDIDLAMKLGTNYPEGPFEMAKILGLETVCQLLEALHQDTGDERYQVCQLLKRKAQGA